MSTVHLVGGEKGGVGKSVVARVLAQFFIDKGYPFVCVDADNSHGAMLRYYGEFTQPADLTDFESADQIMDRALGADRRVLVDLPAQSASLLKAWLSAGDVVGFAKEMGVRLVFWHVSDGGYDSVTELDRVLGELTDQVDYIVVRNFGRSMEFRQLDESAAWGRAQELGARIVDLPKLDSQTMYKIDRLGSSFWAAANVEEGEFCLSAMERRRAKLWLESTYRALDSLGRSV